MEYKELFDKIYNLSKKKKSLVEICEFLDLKDYEVLGLISLMKENGYVIDCVDGNIINVTNDLIIFHQFAGARFLGLVLHN